MRRNLESCTSTLRSKGPADLPFVRSSNRSRVNTTPGLHHHYQSSGERYPKPAIPIAKALLDPEPDLPRLGVPADVEA